MNIYLLKSLAEFFEDHHNEFIEEMSLEEVLPFLVEKFPDIEDVQHYFTMYMLGYRAHIEASAPLTQEITELLLNRAMELGIDVTEFIDK